MRLRVYVTLALLCLSWCAPAHGAPEQSRVTIAVGGKSSLYYLPLTLAERLGYFKKEGLDVEIADFAGGSKALQAMLGGSADVTAGGFDHVVVLQARGQMVQAFVLMVSVPAISVGVAKSRASAYRSPANLKGMRIGVTAPGSSTHMVVNRLLTLGGVASDDVAIIGVGTGPTAVAAMRSGQIDAIANVEPAITILEGAGDIKVVAETMTRQGSNQVFGAALPAGCLYAKQAFIERNPQTARALAHAMVRALQWLEKASAEQVMQTVPKEYLLGNSQTYRTALQKSRATYSVDGVIPATGAKALYELLRAFDPAVKAAPVLAVEKTYDNRFIK
jgi:NitT/TauT family transport system substrate-binding protein